MSFLRKIRGGIERASKSLGKRIVKRGKRVITRGFGAGKKIVTKAAKKSLKDILAGKPDEALKNITDLPGEFGKKGKDIIIEEGTGLAKDVVTDTADAVKKKISKSSIPSIPKGLGKPLKSLGRSVNFDQDKALRLLRTTVKDPKRRQKLIELAKKGIQR